MTVFNGLIRRCARNDSNERIDSMKRLTMSLGWMVVVAFPLAAQTLTGAGATFPNPIYTKWFDAYNKKTGIQINYQSIGSGGGIRQLSEGTVDFGATDGPMNDAELAKAKGGGVLHIPTVIGADVIVYNLPGVASGLKLDGGILADIFLGKIRKWNDSRI